jgi:hypothetical protein
MTLPKLLVYSAIILFGMIGFTAMFKGKTQQNDSASLPLASIQTPIEIDFAMNVKEVAVLPAAPVIEKPAKIVIQPSETKLKATPAENEEKISLQELPEADRIEEFFNLDDKKFPIVETISYKSRVDWQKGRPAWLSDYASHYKTSRHFIARSLNGKPDYLKQDLAEGARFNILKPNKNVQFHLVIDTSRCRMWFYYHDVDTKDKVLVKTYPIGLGRIDQTKISGLLTPLGVFSLGSRIAAYKPKVMGTHHGNKIEMIRVFGTRWIPFEKEIHATTSPAKGFGIHGMPWAVSQGNLIEDTSSSGKYESDGCIRMASQDIEELYSIIITKPTSVEIVKDFFDAENKIQPASAFVNK